MVKVPYLWLRKSLKASTFPGFKMEGGPAFSPAQSRVTSDRLHVTTTTPPRGCHEPTTCGGLVGQRGAVIANHWSMGQDQSGLEHSETIEHRGRRELPRLPALQGSDGALVSSIDPGTRYLGWKRVYSLRCLKPTGTIVASSTLWLYRTVIPTPDTPSAVPLRRRDRPFVTEDDKTTVQIPLPRTNRGLQPVPSAPP
ncbi:hypothetical protein VTI74DRAFT_5891 [Chaetomium olivicolor]